MAQEDVEVVRESFEAFNRGDREAWIATCSEDAELHSLRAQLEGKPYRGHDGLRQFLAELDDLWEYVRFGVREIRDANEWVVVMLDFKARARVSGIELDTPAAMVLATRAGKVSYARFYSNPPDALAAAGLSD